MENIRLNKFLVAQGVCSRREADRLIEAGKIFINGKPATLGAKVGGTEEIVVNGKKVTAQKRKSIIIAYNKPVGVICTSDPSAPGNIIDAVNFPERIFHIGRLDVASSGLILLTNDGDLVNKILRSEGRHEKEYIVSIDVPVTRDMLSELEGGVYILGRMTLPARAQKIDTYVLSLTITEGRNQQIRRMCEVVGAHVVDLTRERIMNIELGDLPLGQWRYLTPTEEKELRALLT
ncbi:MAG: pseudouridine synthase [Candidatus Kerfeldbacteria bacterium]|nr:pseudouridine synthase [Candidatus Kerfeldbacteria bacterium]